MSRAEWVATKSMKLLAVFGSASALGVETAFDTSSSASRLVLAKKKDCGQWLV